MIYSDIVFLLQYWNNYYILYAFFKHLLLFLSYIVDIFVPIYSNCFILLFVTHYFVYCYIRNNVVDLNKVLYIILFNDCIFQTY